MSQPDNQPIDIHRLAARMRDLGTWMEGQEGRVTDREACSAPPLGEVTFSFDAREDPPAASLNHNRVCLCGTAGGLTREGFDEFPARFARRGIKHFFAWLSPGPDIEQLREWLGEAGYKRVPWTRYPTMRLTVQAEPARAHAFDIRAVDAESFASARSALGETPFEGFERTLGKPGFHHFAAFDGERPVATAALVQFEDIGYLTYACTPEKDQNRGAQSALIAHRVALAKSLGCEHIMSQTLTMLERSLANLQRAGFPEIYEQEVYEFGAA